MPCCTLGDPLPYIPGAYHKTTTFVIENNVSPLRYLINITRQQKPMVSEERWFIICWIPLFFEDM